MKVRKVRNMHDDISGDYRPDIQGLRAISILAVVFYHAKLPGFSGGFVGVDVFFVISGFLICRLLLKEAITTGRIDLLRFWGRRARRLLPNALLTLLAILLLSAVVVTGITPKSVAADVNAAALYFSNYRFAANAVDYFHFDDPPSPILHFWSLSVEEQFYIAWPILLLSLCLALPRKLLAGSAALIGLVGLLSFAACMIVARDNQALAFFHSETRAWQLAVGGLLAACSLIGSREFQFLRANTLAQISAVLAVLGVTAISLSVYRIDDSMRYPGVLALAPTLGAAAVIGSGLFRGTPGLISRFMGCPLFRWIGARSYSWYLWHWPLLIFAQALFPDKSDAALLSLPISLAIASIVYSYWEDPIHKNRLWPATPGRSLKFAGTAIASVIIIGTAIARVPFLGTHVPQPLIDALRKSTTDFGRNYADKCHLDYDVIKQPECAYGLKAASKRAVLFGDSHAAQWFPPLEAAALKTGWELDARTKSSCPSVEVTIWYPPRRTAFTACNTWRAEIMRELTRERRPDVVFLSNLVNYRGWIEDRITGDVLKGANADAAWRRGFRQVLEELTYAGVQVIVIRDTPAVFKSFGKCLEEGGEAKCDRRRTEALPEPSLDVEVARDFGNRVKIMDLSDQICSAETCPVIKDAMIVYQDHHHLTATFAMTMSEQFERLLSRVGGTAAKRGIAKSADEGRVQ